MACTITKTRRKSISPHKSDPFTGRSKTTLPKLKSVGGRANSVQELADNLGVPQRRARQLLDKPDKHSVGGRRIA